MRKTSDGPDKLPVLAGEQHLTRSEERKHQKTELKHQRDVVKLQADVEKEKRGLSVQRMLTDLVDIGGNFILTGASVGSIEALLYFISRICAEQLKDHALLIFFHYMHVAIVAITLIFFFMKTVRDLKEQEIKDRQTHEKR